MMYILFFGLSCLAFQRIFVMTLNLDIACLQLKQLNCSHERELLLKCSIDTNESHPKLSKEKPPTKITEDGNTSNTTDTNESDPIEKLSKEKLPTKISQAGNTSNTTDNGTNGSQPIDKLSEEQRQMKITQERNSSDTTDKDTSESGPIEKLSKEKPPTTITQEGNNSNTTGLLEGFHELRRQNVSYMFKYFQGYKSFEAAANKCQELNGNLAQFQDEFKWEFVQNHTLFSLYMFACTWIGLKRNGSEYSWLDGTVYRDEARWGLYQREKADMLYQECVCIKPSKEITLQIKTCWDSQKYLCEVTIEHKS